MLADAGYADVFDFKNPKEDFTGASRNFTSILSSLGYTARQQTNFSHTEAFSLLTDSDDIFVFQGHGSGVEISIKFTDSNGNLFGYIQAISPTNSDTRKSLLTCETNELSNLRCVLYLGCSTAVDRSVSRATYNLSKTTYELGAHFVLGTSEAVFTSECDIFLNEFLTMTEAGFNIYNCISYASFAASNDAYSTHYFPIVYYGDVYQQLNNLT